MEFTTEDPLLCQKTVIVLVRSFLILSIKVDDILRVTLKSVYVLGVSATQSTSTGVQIAKALHHVPLLNCTFDFEEDTI